MARPSFVAMAKVTQTAYLLPFFQLCASNIGDLGQPQRCPNRGFSGMNQGKTRGIIPNARIQWRGSRFLPGIDTPPQLCNSSARRELGQSTRNWASYHLFIAYRWPSLFLMGNFRPVSIEAMSPRGWLSVRTGCFLSTLSFHEYMACTSEILATISFFVHFHHITLAG